MPDETKRADRTRSFGPDSSQAYVFAASSGFYGTFGMNLDGGFASELCHKLRCGECAVGNRAA
jgi:hypothetical protein